MKVLTPVLEVGFEEYGPSTGIPVVLLHGFPYDIRSYEAVAPILADAGCRAVVPYLRGFGSTRFHAEQTMRSGQQAALGQDVIDLLDALEIPRAIVAGFDWGGRAACVAAALHPERIIGLVSVDGYNIQDIAHGWEPESAAREKAKWYQHLFQSESGRLALERDREAVCQLLWADWSPTWSEAKAAFTRSAPSFHNPDWIDVVLHSYRHRRGNAPGDPAYASAEERLAAAPAISVPTVVLAPTDDGFGFNDPLADQAHFTGPFRGEWMLGVGHNPPQEGPQEFARAILSLV